MTDTTTRQTLQIGPHSIWPPVVLAPMAGVTNVVFRRLCRTFAQAAANNNEMHPALFVSEMVSARALIFDDARTWEAYVAFTPDERPRSLQLYGFNPADVGEAVRRLVEGDHVDHLDLNFGCPVAKITRKGGGAAIPVKPRLLEAIVRAAVQAAGPVPVTMKFRMGIDEDLSTFLDAGRIGEAEGCAAVALHGRTAAQLYEGAARWEPIAELKAAVTTIPVLGNGDIWEAADALRLMDETGCDGVVVGRGCLGRPWLFADLVRLFQGDAPVGPPTLGEVADVALEHAAQLVSWAGERRGVIDFRKHLRWYTQGYGVGRMVAESLAGLHSLDDVERLLDKFDRSRPCDPAALSRPRGKHNSRPQRVALPDGYLENRYDATPPGADADDRHGG